MGRRSSVEEIEIARMSEGAERRKMQRFDCRGPAEMMSIETHQLYRGEIKDLSLTGCYILTATEKLDMDRRADVELCLTVNGDPLNTPARVLIVRPNAGAVFEFLPVDPEMRAALLVLIQKLAAALTTPEGNQTG